MKNTSLLSVLLFALALTILSACGGGSSSSSAPPQPTTAVLTLSTAVTSTGTIPANTTVNSYDVTVTLPNGVTVMTMPAPNSSVTTTDVLFSSGTASASTLISGFYTAASGSFPGTVKVLAYNATSFGPALGEFGKLKVNVAAGLSAPAANFKVTLDDATGIDSTLSTVTGLQSQLTVTIK